MKIKKWDLLICIVLAAILMIFVLELGNTHPAARVYPAIMLIASYVLIAGIIIQWVKTRKERQAQEAPGMDKKRVLYILVYCVSILVYILLIERLGYVASTIIFGIYSLIYTKNKNKILIIVLPIIMTAVLYFLFSKFLFVTLPTGILI